MFLVLNFLYKKQILASKFSIDQLTNSLVKSGADNSEVCVVYDVLSKL